MATTLVSHQDYCNSPMGPPASLLPAKTAVNPAARVIFSKLKADHIIHLLKKQKLLSTLLRIKVHCCSHGLSQSCKLASCYLPNLFYCSPLWSVYSSHTGLLTVSHTHCKLPPTPGPLQGCVPCLDHLSLKYLHCSSFPIFL